MIIGILQVASYFILIFYIFFALKTKTLKVKIITIASIIVSMTVGARLLYVINNGDYYRPEIIFYPKLGYFKIAGGLIGSIVTLLILRKIFFEDKKEIYNSVFEGLFLAGGFAKLNCHLIRMLLWKRMFTSMGNFISKISNFQCTSNCFL